MFTQRCKQHFTITLFRQPIFTSKTYNHLVTYNRASAYDNLRLYDSRDGITNMTGQYMRSDKELQSFPYITDFTFL